MHGSSALRIYPPLMYMYVYRGRFMEQLSIINAPGKTHDLLARGAASGQGMGKRSQGGGVPSLEAGLGGGRHPRLRLSA